jgi:L-amino acid N-acyltransferase YncA
MANPWIIQDGPYWRSRAEVLRRTADETETFRPQTRARMLQIARDLDVMAERAEQTGVTERLASIDKMREKFRTSRRGRPPKRINESRPT